MLTGTIKGAAGERHRRCVTWRSAWQFGAAVALARQVAAQSGVVLGRCYLTADAASPIHSLSGESIYIEPDAAAGGHSKVLVMGQPVVVYGEDGRPQMKAGMVGALLTRAGAEAISPPNIEASSERSFVSFDPHGTWDVVWLQRSTQPPSVSAQYARFDGHAWSGVQRIGVIPGLASVGSGVDAPMARSGRDVGVAVPLLQNDSGGAIALFLRRRGQWTSSLLASETGSGVAYASLLLGRSATYVAYVSGGTPPTNGSNALYIRVQHASVWSGPTRISDQGAFEPRVLELDGLHPIVVWQQVADAGRHARRELWMARLNPDGSLQGRPARITAEGGLDPSMAFAELADSAVLALAQFGGPDRREQRFIRITREGASEVYRDSVQAATAVILARQDSATYRAIWGRFRPGGVMLPESMSRFLHVRCRR